jgi:hypothetical protein
MHPTPMRPARLTDRVPQPPMFRRGVITVWSLFALLVCGACTALVINQLWINAARANALRCAEAAALAAGHKLLCDEMLRPQPGEFEQQGRITRSRMAAMELCELYRQSTPVPALRASDIHYQGPSLSDDASESSSSGQGTEGPEQVTVGYRTGDGRYRIPLFLSGLTGMRDVALGVEATVRLEHTPAGFQPGPLMTIPMMPFCLPDDDGETGAESWSLRIEKRPKSDRFAWVEERNVVESGPDGLPEITVTLTSGRPSMTCEALVPLQWCRDPFGSRAFQRQMSSGLSDDDLTSVGLENIRFPQSVTTCSIPRSALDGLAEELGRLKGRAMLWCLTDVNQSNDSDADNSADSSVTVTNAAAAEEGSADPEPVPDRITLTRPVAARIVHVRMRSKQQVQVTLQPCVLATVTAMMESAVPANNRYVYSVRLVQ